MLRVWTGNKWQLARSAPKEIKRGKSKGKFWVFIYTGNPDHPQGLKRVKVSRDDFKEIEQIEPPAVSPDLHRDIEALQTKAKAAVKYGNGIKQTTLFKKPEQRSLF